MPLLVMRHYRGQLVDWKKIALYKFSLKNANIYLQRTQCSKRTRKSKRSVCLAVTPALILNLI